jgi:hypothetical protein
MVGFGLQAVWGSWNPLQGEAWDHLDSTRRPDCQGPLEAGKQAGGNPLVQVMVAGLVGTVDQGNRATFWLRLEDG